MKIQKMARLACLSTVAALGFAAAPANAAVTVTTYGTTNLGAFTYSVSGHTITLNETWINTNNVFLQFNGLDTAAYTIVKNVINNSGSAWTSIANELLDPGVDSNDPNPQPGFVPAGYSTSSDTDGLSFNQNGSTPRTSNLFPSKIVDEFTDARDFIDFYGATAVNGSSFNLSYGLIDTGGNQPFLLSQRVNVLTRGAVPEPSTWLTMLFGFCLIGGLMRRQARTGIARLA